MNVAFPRELHRGLALLALDDNASINELIRDAVKEYLKRRTGKRGKKP